MKYQSPPKSTNERVDPFCGRLPVQPKNGRNWFLLEIEVQFRLQLLRVDLVCVRESKLPSNGIQSAKIVTIGRPPKIGEIGRLELKSMSGTARSNQPTKKGQNRLQLDSFNEQLKLEALEAPYEKKLVVSFIFSFFFG